MADDSVLVYSTDPEKNKMCTRCKKLLSSCICKKNGGANLAAISAALRIEKKQRGGKEVTVIDKLPASEDFLKDLAQQLKKKCGTGGTYKIENEIGSVEIQGNKGDIVRQELSKLGIKCR